MTLFDDVKEAFDEGFRQYERIMNNPEDAVFNVTESYGTGQERNRLIFGDNLSCMANLIKNEKMSGKIQLIYVDPPFFSNSKYEASVKLHSEVLGDSKLLKIGAYDDHWNKGLKQYLTMLTVRLLLIKELLSDTGCLWVHLDWHVVHYVKIILDNIFGQNNFVNEIIWNYKSGGANKRSFARKHDNLLLYAKGKKYCFNQLKEKSYNRDYKPYRFKGVEEFQDDTGWYTMVGMKDVWNIDMVGRTSSERNGYATQKPEKLLERIIESCSNQGDICADFFAGSGTLGAVCKKLGRKWIMCDESGLSAACQSERMGKLGDSFDVEYKDVPVSKGIPDITFDGMQIVLGGYTLKPGEKDISCVNDSNAAEEVAKYIEKDSLSFIKCWSVDFDYDGKVHRADRIITDGETRCAINDGSLGERISIAGYDVFGNRFFEILKTCSFIRNY